MTFESVRKRLIARSGCTKWGDPPPTHGILSGSATIETESTPKAAAAAEPNLQQLNEESPSLSPPPQAHSPAVDDMNGQEGPRRRTVISTEGWTLENILASSSRFQPVERVVLPSSPQDTLGTASFAAALANQDEPLVIQGLHDHQNWPQDSTFTVDWLLEHGAKTARARNIHSWDDIELPLPEFIKKSRATSQYTVPGETERLYGKDAECPAVWEAWMKDAGVVPPSLLPSSPQNVMLYPPAESQVETLMSYIGIGDTFTPAHKDLCASSGQNLMVYSEKKGSSFWFMTKGSDAPLVEEYFHSLSEELDLETHVITLKELAKAKFTVYVVEQKLGDLVLVPPRCVHQVVNNGGITIKVSWSRMTTRGLATSFYHELPIYRRVCRSETYRIKSLIQWALTKSTSVLEAMSRQTCPDPETKQTLVDDLTLLIPVFDDVLKDEWAAESNSMKTPHSMSHITCDFCSADIYQSWFECLACGIREQNSTEPPLHGDGIAICPGCFVEGRTCKCQSGMQPMQMRKFYDLITVREKASSCLKAAANFPAVPDHLAPRWIHKFLKDENHSGLFASACLLRELRTSSTNDLNESRRCSDCLVDSERNHDSPYFGVMRCKPCHRASCYHTVLKRYKIHSSEALRASNKDQGNAAWHSAHADSRHVFEELLPRLKEAAVNGTRPDLKAKLVDVALNFETCRPANYEAVGAGFYDRQAQVDNIPTEPATTKILEGPELLPNDMDSERFSLEPNEAGPSKAKPDEEGVRDAPRQFATCVRMPTRARWQEIEREKKAKGKRSANESTSTDMDVDSNSAVMSTSSKPIKRKLARVAPRPVSTNGEEDESSEEQTLCSKTNVQLKKNHAIRNGPPPAKKRRKVETETEKEKDTKEPPAKRRPPKPAPPRAAKNAQRPDNDEAQVDSASIVEDYLSPPAQLSAVAAGKQPEGWALLARPLTSIAIRPGATPVFNPRTAASSSRQTSVGEEGSKLPEQVLSEQRLAFEESAAKRTRLMDERERQMNAREERINLREEMLQKREETLQKRVAKCEESNFTDMFDRRSERGGWSEGPGARNYTTTVTKQSTSHVASADRNVPPSPAYLGRGYNAGAGPSGPRDPQSSPREYRYTVPSLQPQRLSFENGTRESWNARPHSEGSSQPMRNDSFPDNQFQRPDPPVGRGRPQKRLHMSQGTLARSHSPVRNAYSWGNGDFRRDDIHWDNQPRQTSGEPNGPEWRNNHNTNNRPKPSGTPRRPTASNSHSRTPRRAS